MTSGALKIGDVVVVAFPTHDPQKHEQQGYRPAVVVGLPDVAGTARFSMVVVTPMTSDRGQAWAQAAPNLYPQLPAGTAGLPADSIVLIDQVRAVDISRIPRQLGTLNATEYRPIRQGLKVVFDL